MMPIERAGRRTVLIGLGMAVLAWALHACGMERVLEIVAAQ